MNLASLDEPAERIGPSDPILVVGSPAYDALPALPDSRREAIAVAGKYRNPTLLLGEQATAANMIRYVPQATVLHFGGHAVVNPLAPRFSSLALASVDGHDTRVYLHELLERRQPLKLVVLAACSTAQRSTGGARGTLTIARAFLDGGARSVVGTLWPVSDAAAARFSASFHESLLHGQDIAAAARSAQLELKSQSGDDLTWAAFCVFQGNVSKEGETK